MSEHGLPCGEYAVRNMISLMTGKYYDCGSGGKRFRDCVLMEARAGSYRVSSMLRSALANPDFCSALEDVLAFAIGRYETYYMSDEGLLSGGNILMRMCSVC